MNVHSRLAMMVTMGMFFQDGLTGPAWGDRALYTAPPATHPEYEPGAQAPGGFWDFVDFIRDGSVEISIASGPGRSSVDAFA